MTALLVLAAALAAAAPAPPAGESGCVSCHRAADGGAIIGHSFQEWEHSAHARAGIECQHCHGGDPAAAKAPEAHRGLNHSGDPRSPLFFRNVPEHCGSCHQPEFGAFKRSKHFKELKRTGKGPNCLTCHGAMAVSIPTPGFLQGTCASCHDQPLKVYEALTALRQSRRVLRRMQSVHQRAQEAKLATATEAKEATAIEALYGSVQDRWHQFRMAEVLDDLHAVSRRAGRLAGDLEVRLRAERGTK